MKETIDVENPKTDQTKGASDTGRGQEIDERFKAMEDFQRLNEEYKIKSKKQDELHQQILGIIQGRFGLSQEEQIKLEGLQKESAELHNELGPIHQRRSTAHKKSMAGQSGSTVGLLPNDFEKDIYPGETYDHMNN